MSSHFPKVNGFAACVCVLLGIPAGVGTFAFQYGEGTSYLSNDPRACVNCHIMRDQYDGWQKASHHAFATCNDCHTPHDLVGKYLTKADNGFWHSKGFTFQGFHEPIRIKPRNSKVLRDNCIACHRDLVSELIDHGSAKESQALDCVRCHATVGHGPVR